MFVVLYRKFFYAFSITLLAISIGAMIFHGFNFGIDFKGGTITQVTYTDARPSLETVQDAIKALALPNAADTLVQPANEKSYIIKNNKS
jgi:preprotein translocase subunit SecF